MASKKTNKTSTECRPIEGTPTTVYKTNSGSIVAKLFHSKLCDDAPFHGFPDRRYDNDGRDDFNCGETYDLVISGMNNSGNVLFFSKAQDIDLDWQLRTVRFTHVPGSLTWLGSVKGMSGVALTAGVFRRMIAMYIDDDKKDKKYPALVFDAIVGPSEREGLMEVKGLIPESEDVLFG